MAAPRNSHIDLTKGVRYRRLNGLAKAIRIIGSSSLNGRVKVNGLNGLIGDSYASGLNGVTGLTGLTGNVGSDWRSVTFSQMKS